MDVRKEWILTQHQDTGKQVTSDPIERDATKNTTRPWWIALETTNELENCLKGLEREASRKRRNWPTQQRVEVNKLELQSLLGRTWENLLLEYFEDAMRAPSSAPALMANPFVWAVGQMLFSWTLVGVTLEALTSFDKLKLGDTGLRVYQTLVQHIAPDNSGLSLARRKDTTCFLRWIMSVMSDTTVQTCHQRATGSKR